MSKKDVGKQFEDEFRASIPNDWYVERYKDDTAGFQGVSNPADFRIYKYPYLMLLELKSTKGKSLPFSRIRDNQLKGMLKAIKHDGIYGGFVINYRDLAETYYIPVELVANYKAMNDRKSIPVDWCREWGTKLEQELKRVRYKYDLESWLGRYKSEKV